MLPHPPRDSRTFDTKQGAAVFSCNPLDVLHVPEGRLLDCRPSGRTTSSTPRSMASTIVTVESQEVAASCSCIRSTSPSWRGGRDRSWTSSASGRTDRAGRAKGFRVVSYDQPRGCAAAYYPETNELVPLDSTALESNCPTSKSVIIRLDPNGHREAGSTGRGGEQGEDEGHKARPQPTHRAERQAGNGSQW